MPDNNYIYFFRYDETESMLCKLESNYLFNTEEQHKQLFSNLKIEPSRSAFIKKRLDVISSSSDYTDLIDQIKKENIKTDGFKVEYLLLEGDTLGYRERLSKLKDVGYSIDTFPDYHNPTITYGLCTYEGQWYFGVIIKNDFSWQKHKQKPHSYSNSIKQNIAKSLVNIAVGSKQDVALLDACCGVGTIMLEACYGGYNIEGCDISWKTCKNARANLIHFNYNATVHCSDLKDITKQYDVAIIDLPYNIYTKATDQDIQHIIKSAADITDHLVIVSSGEIVDAISQAKLKVVNSCNVSKPGKSNFTRKIWVCETANNSAYLLNS